MGEEGEFKEISLQDLVINSDGETGIPFNILRKEFGFEIEVKGKQVFIKAPSKGFLRVHEETALSGELVSHDNFNREKEILKDKFGFKEYYQDSLIYSSQNRGIKRYDIIISATEEWYNISIKGDYESSCNRDDILPELIKFYFPLSYGDVLSGIRDNKTHRHNYDNRETLITNEDIDSKELIFSISGGRLK